MNEAFMIIIIKYHDNADEKSYNNNFLGITF